MTEKSYLSDSIKTAKLHLERAKFSHLQLQKIQLKPETFADNSMVQIIDSFIFRFTKLQDFMGQNLFKNLLKATGDYQDNMAMIDILDKMEKLELIPSSDEWLKYRKERNKLTHEYPAQEGEIIEGLNIMIKYFPKIEQILLLIEKYSSKLTQ